MATIDKLPLTSMNITEEQLLNFKLLFPEVFTEGLKVDWEKLKLTLGETIDIGKERYGMNWPGKADCFKTIQQPSIATLVPAREESIDFDTTENLFIEGDNLEVLKLLQKSYLGKVKMIYIDPPYNTGNEFIYPDNYGENLQTYLEYTGQIDSEGRKFGTNTDTDGRFHSKWMNMMYPRLFLAKNLLKDDGVIFISIDDNEVINLKILCNEIFGEENFFANVIWQKKYAASNDAKGFAAMHDHIMVFTKSEKFNRFLLPRTDKQNSLYKFDSNDGKGLWRSDNLTVKTFTESYYYEIENPNTKTKHLPTKGRCWLTNSEKVNQWIKEGRVFFGQDGRGAPQLKRYLNEVQDGIVPQTIWSYDEVGHTDEARKEIKALFENPPFDTPKPTRLIKRILQISTSTNDLILDFFAGSATTAHAVMEMNNDGGNRKFICVQIPEPTEEKSEAYKAGYKNIAEISKERIRRVSAKIKKEKESLEAKEKENLFKDEFKNKNSDLGFKVFKLDHSNFKIWDATLEKEPEAIQQRLFEHIDHIAPEAAQESILYELLLKSGFELTTPIDKLTLADKTVFSIASGQLLICLEKKLNNEVLKAMAELQPTRVICLDEAFIGINADALKTNAVQIMKSKGVVNFRTV